MVLPVFILLEEPPRGRAGTAGDRDVADGERVLPHDKAYDFFPVTYKGMLSKEHDSVLKEKLPEFFFRIPAVIFSCFFPVP